MKQFLGLFLVVVTNAEPDTSAVTATPLSKVLDMLDTMLATCKEGKNTEETEFAKFSKWCGSTRTGYERSIAEATSKIEQLQADITKATADAAEHAALAAEHSATADTSEKELENATAIRAKENEDYRATHSDFEDAINAIERAKSVLASRAADVKQSLAQVRTSIRHSKGGPVAHRAVSEIDALLAFGSKQAPEANAYEFQSSSVVDMLEKMRLKFQDEKLALQKSELSNRANHEVLAQRLTATIKESTAVAAEKTAAKAQRLDDASAAKGDLAMTETAKAEDEKALDDLNAQCHANSDEFEKNQVLRSEEVKAIEKASEILRSEDVSGNAATYLPTALAQRGSTAALVQLRGGPSEPSDALRSRATALLQGRAASLGSRYLSLAASRIAADPFGKVKKMIGDMIVKLMEQANSEADKHAFCTTELATNKQTRDTKQAEVEELSARVEKYTAESEKLATELAELSDAVAELKGRIAEATGLRQEEKEVNAKTVADAKASQVAVERAVQVLKEFYAKAGGGSFVQEAAKAPYTGMQTENGNVLGFLEVVLSDFARLEAETTSAEDQAQEEYSKFMDESDENLAVKATEISHNEDAKRDAESSAASSSKELALTHEELDTALVYYDKLKSDCVQTGLSYADRKAKREEEIESLKEALKILGQGILGEGGLA
jgi:hypothetical protein